MTLVEDQLLDTHSAARLLDIPGQTLAVWRHRKVGPPFIRIAPREIRYSRVALEHWMHTRRNAIPEAAS